MPNLFRALSATTALALLCPGLGFSQGLISTVTNRSNPTLATASLFGVAARDANTIFIADSANNQIDLLNRRTGQITVFAGSGTRGFAGDGGPANQAQLNQPSGMVLDHAGNLLIADTNNQRVRRINLSSNTISTVAGSGAAGFGGDGGPATAASFNSPSALAVDSSNNIYVSDTLNSRIRFINASDGTILTVAGNGAAGFSGDNGAATNAQLDGPVGITLDTNNHLYIADVLNDVVREVASGIITTVAGQGRSAGYSGDGQLATSALLDFPYGVQVNTNGDLYITEARNNVIRRVSGPATNRIISTVAGTSGVGYTGDGGSAIQATMSAPTYLSLDDLGNLFFIDSGNEAIRRVSTGLYFVPVAPCRVVDTRLASGPFGAPFMSANTSRDFAIRNSNYCPGTVPTGADVQAYSLNVTVVPHAPLSFLTIYPTAATRPVVSTLNSYDARIKANAAIVPANTGDINRSVSVFVTGDTDLILDINGYYVSEATANSLAYFPLAPCRLVDTRQPSSTPGLGSPSMVANQNRDFALLTGSCGLPTSAQAYALNFTSLPQAPLSFLTTWPTGSTRPVVSTLNSNTAAVTANAAIVPAGSNGSISVYATAATDLIIDVSGYYAPVGSGSNGLALYNLTPCRAYDSRHTGSDSPISGVNSENIVGPCSAPVTAQSLVLNTTVIPVSSVSYLTAWARGATQPVQSTLNAYDGAVTSNLAVVPTTDGFISTYTPEQTGLLLDLFGVFAQ